MTIKKEIAPITLFAALRTAREAVAVKNRTPWLPANEYRGVARAAEAALKELERLIVDLSRGQCGAAFVTRYSPIANPAWVKLTLWVNRRRAAVVTMHDDDRNWIELVDQGMAEEEFREDKAQRYTKQAYYNWERKALILSLLAHEPPPQTSFGVWRYFEGQRGGVYYRHGNGVCVGAEGAYYEAECRAGGPLLGEPLAVDYEREFESKVRRFKRHSRGPKYAA